MHHKLSNPTLLSYYLTNELSTLLWTGPGKRGQHRSGLGLHATRHDGTLIQQCSVSCCSSTPLQSELMAILLAVKWALLHNFNVVFLCSDCLTAIMLVAGCSESHHEDKFWLHNLGRELSKLAFCKLSKVDRIDTLPTHCLPKSALLSTTASPDARGTSFWTGATTDFHLLFV